MTIEVSQTSPLSTGTFDRGGWRFERVVKIGGRSSWWVMRSDGE